MYIIIKCDVVTWLFATSEPTGSSRKSNLTDAAALRMQSRIYSPDDRWLHESIASIRVVMVVF